jgi:hypothetical protein
MTILMICWKAPEGRHFKEAFRRLGRMVPQPLRVATPATPIQSELLHELGILRDGPNLEMVWPVAISNDRGPPKGRRRTFALDLAHELPLTICTQQGKMFESASTHCHCRGSRIRCALFGKSKSS